MSYQVLARKWRPRVFDEVVGQEHVVRALVNGLDQDRLHQAYLLTGTRGVGKTTLARILAKCLNCEQGVSSKPCGECGACVDIDEGRFVDMLEIDAASRTGVDETRELMESVQFTPTRGRYKVYIIDEVHMLSKHSFNALLKTLEEPPPHVKFVLATTDPQKIPVTILSRCLRFGLRRLMPDQIAGQLTHILEAEGIEAEAQAVLRLARAADGSMRDGLSLLDQAIAFGGGKLDDTEVAEMLGSIEQQQVRQLLAAVGAGEGERVLEISAELVAQSRDLEAVLAELADSLHRVALVQLAPGFSDPERSDSDAIAELAASMDPEDVQLYYEIALQGRRQLNMAPDPRTGLEMTLLRMLAFRPVDVAESRPAGGSAPAKAAPRKPAAKKPAAAAKASAGPAPKQTQAERGNGHATVAAADPGLPWPEFVTGLQLRGAERELARHLELTGRGERRWTFRIPSALQHLAAGAPVDRLTAAVGAAAGREVELKIVPTDDALETMAADDEARTRNALDEARQAIEDDPTVRSLRENLGAEVVPDSIQPLQADGQ